MSDRPTPVQTRRVPPGHRLAPAGRAGELWRRRHTDDEGLTLVEVLIAMAILLTVMTLSTTIISSYFTNGAQINGAYRGFQEIIPSTTAMQQYMVTMVEPNPAGVSGGVFVPVPPFAYNPPVGSAGNNPALPPGYQLSPNSATFTSNVGDPNGPAEIQVTTTPNAAPRPGQPQTYTLIATSTPADPGTCPGVSSGTQCTWGVTTTTKRLFTITDLVNGAVDAPTPVFQFTTTTSAGPVTPYATAAGSTWQTTFGPNTCSSRGNCPADQISSVTITLEIEPSGGETTAYHTTVTPISIPYAQNVG